MPRCYDFVVNQDLRRARDVYDDHYAHWPTYDNLTLEAITEPWFDDVFPWRRTMLENLGSLAGDKVLLLGNGMQYKEYFFLHLGAQVVFTDLSFMAVKRAQTAFRRSELFDKHRNHI